MVAPLKLQVDQAAGGKKVEAWLARAVPGVSLERARRLLAEGRVRIRGKAVKAGRKLWGNEEVELELPAPAAVRGSEGAPLPLLFESAEAIVVDKPPGMVVEPDGHNPSVIERLSAQLRSGLDVEGRAAPGVVHRLDRDTTGCVVVGRTDAAVAALEEAFEQKRVVKEYLALVLGAPPERDRLEAPYGRSVEDPRRYTTRVESARRAALSFERLEQLSEVALLRVRLETGRTHQIRVQLSEAGFPLLGDPLYGTDPSRTHPAAVALGRVALHSEHLAIEGKFDCRAPLPADFERALERCRRG